MTPVSEAHELPAGVHPTAAILPWYVSGTLRAVECAEVNDHLEQCAACRAELESLLKLATALRSAYQTMPDASQQVRTTVMNLAKSPVVAIGAPTPARRERSLGDRLADGIRSWFQPKWVPALAVAVLTVQFGLLIWSLPQNSQPPQVTTRSIAAAPLRINVKFNSQATEQDIREALRSLGGSVVAGPNAQGAYLVEIPPGDPRELQQKLAKFREDRGLVLEIGPAN